MRAHLSFAAVDRLHRSAEFLRLQHIGARFQSPHFVLYVGSLDHEPERSRLGVTVSRRIGNAVVRNRVKRRVRECFRRAMRAHLPVWDVDRGERARRRGCARVAAIGEQLEMAARNFERSNHWAGLFFDCT